MRVFCFIFIILYFYFFPQFNRHAFYSKLRVAFFMWDLVYIGSLRTAVSDWCGCYRSLEDVYKCLYSLSVCHLQLSYVNKEIDNCAFTRKKWDTWSLRQLRRGKSRRLPGSPRIWSSEWWGASGPPAPWRSFRWLWGSCGMERAFSPFGEMGVTGKAKVTKNN